MNTLRDNNRNELFIGGDINVDLLRPNTVNSKYFLKFIKINQLRQLINKFTRPDSNACLDLIMTDCDMMKEYGTLPINISDHLPVYCIRKKQKVTKTNVEFSGRSYKNLDNDRLSMLLNEYNWNELANLDVDNSWNLMYTRIKTVIDILCPIKLFKFSKEKPIG